MNVGYKIEAKITEAIMIPAEHLTMEEAVEKLKEQGHDIIKKDGRKIYVYKEK